MFLACLSNFFHATLSITPGNRKEEEKTRGFLMFSRGIERDQCHEMGLVIELIRKVGKQTEI